jgi:hypothetical protein
MKRITILAHLDGRVLAFVLAAMLCFAFQTRSCAVDSYWDRGAGTANYTTATNWLPNFVPEASFHERAVIGTDDPGALLNGSAAITANPPQVGGIALGLRERNSLGEFLNPEPVAGTLVGSLSILNSVLTSRSTAVFANGIDGIVRVGVDGRGYLLINNATLNATGLNVGGEILHDLLGPSKVTLQGTSTVNVTIATGPIGANPAGTGNVNFTRNLQVIGPNVSFNVAKNLAFGTDSNYLAEITHPSLHSTLKNDGDLVLDGSLFVQFSGAGTSHVLGQTWNLFDTAGSITGNFDNLSSSGGVVVSGGSTLPGAIYRLQTIFTPTNRRIVQLLFTEIPEPGSTVLMAIGVVPLLIRRRAHSLA